MMHKILVTDAEQSKSVPIIRTLGQAGLHVVCGASKRYSLGFYYKYCKKRYRYPEPEKEEDFIAWLIDMAKRGAFTILFPIDERTMTPVTRHLATLQKYMQVPVVDHQTYMVAHDKSKTMERAKACGVPIPKTWWFPTVEDFYEKQKEITIPCIIKPRISSGSRGLRYIYERNDLERGFLEIHKNYPYPLVQDLLPSGGATFGVELLLNQGHVIASFMHKRLREYPLSGEPSTLRESVYDKDLIETALRLLTSIGWHGVAMVEFKVDPRDQVARLMEINPKFWGSIALPIFAGVNFPHLLYQLAVGDAIQPFPSYRYPVRCRWLIPGDILHFITNPNRFQLNPSFFDFRGESDDLIDREDLGPLYGMFLSFLSRVSTENLWRKYIGRG
jgi:predicted ATP-grasp superfamily ATP-dependent carboligase